MPLKTINENSPKKAYLEIHVGMDAERDRAIDKQSGCFPSKS